MGMVKMRKGRTVDSGAADHVMPISRLLMFVVVMFVVVKSIGLIQGLQYVAADGTQMPNVGQQLIKFMTRRDLDRAPVPERGDQLASRERVQAQRCRPLGNP